MASPQQRPDPDRNRRDYEDLQRARMEGRPATGAGFAWWWLFWIIVIALAIWWAGWGWGGSGGWWWGGRTRNTPAYGTNTAPGNTNTAPGGNQAVISGRGLSVLSATNKDQYIGKPFRVSDVPVQKKISDTVFWVGPKNAPPTLLVLKNNPNGNDNGPGPLKKNGTTFRPGDLIDITGTVEKAPPQAQAQQKWALNGSDATQLERQGGYILGTLVFYVPR